MRSPLLSLATLLSGAAGLVYELVWVRRFADTFGHGVLAVQIVLTAFFLGMGIGAAWGGRRVDRCPDSPHRLYAGLELVLAACALAFLPAVDVLEAVYLAAAPADWAPAAAWSVKALAAIVLLGVPTVAMGATLPVIVRCAARLAASERAVNPGPAATRVAWLYGVNTVGAAIGCVLVTFVLLPRWGMVGSLAAGAAANVAAAVAVWVAVRGLGARVSPVPVADVRPDAAPPSPPGAPALRRAFLAAALSTGFVGIGFEVLWTRALSAHSMNSVYSFAIILAVFLVSLGAGSLVVAVLARRGRVTPRLCSLAVAFTGLAGLASMPVLARLGGREIVSFGATQGAELLRAFAVMLPCGLLLGASFPMLVRLAARGARSEGTDVGRVYLANTAGAVLAPLVVGALLLPAVEMGTSILILSGCALLTAGALAVAVRARWIGALVLGAGSAVTIAAFAVPADLRRWSRGPGVELVDYREGVAASVAVERVAGGLSLWVNRSYRLGSSQASYAQRRQGLLPALLHPSPRRALVIGLGTGCSAGALAALGNIAVDAAEILPEVVDVLPHFAAHNHDLARRARARDDVRLLVVDGRHFVRGTARRYDLVIGDLFVPWRAGEGAMFAREHFAAVRDCLADGGLFCQWLPLYQLPHEDLATIVATFCSEFPAVSAWWLYFNVEAATIGLLGAKQPLMLDPRALALRMQDEATAALLRENGLTDPHRLRAAWIAGDAALRRWSDGAAIESRTRPRTEFGAPRRRARGERVLAHAGVELMLELSEDAPHVPGYGALTTSESAATRNHLDAARHALRADVALGEDDLELAVAELVTALRGAPRWGWVQSRLELAARRALASGRLPLVERAADAFAAIPDVAHVGHYFAALAAVRAGDRARALREVDAALRVRPDHVPSQQLREQVLR